jgi:hypothetical protein
MARLARLGPAGIDTCCAGADAIGGFPIGVAVVAVARTPTANAAVTMVVLVAIVIALSLSPREVPRTHDWLITKPT